MPDIESLLRERRVFEPSDEFARKANWNKKTVAEYRKLGESSPERFWGKMAKEHVSWFTPWKQVLEWKEPFAKWFVGGKTNVSYNCLDAIWATPARRNKAAIIWEGEPGDVARAHLPAAAPRGLQVRQRAQGAGRQEGRRGRHLHADGARSWPSPCWPAPGSARSTAWSSAASRPRRSRPQQRRRRQAGDHGRRRLAARQAVVPLKENVDEALAKSPTVENVRGRPSGPARRCR